MNINAKEGKHSPVAKAHSLISGDKLNLEWGTKLGR